MSEDKKEEELNSEIIKKIKETKDTKEKVKLVALNNLMQKKK